MKLQSSSRKFGASLPGSCNDREYNFLAKSIWSLLAAFDFGFDADDADDDDDVKNLFKDRRFCRHRWTKSWSSFSVSAPSSPAVAMEVLFDSCNKRFQ